MNLEIKNVDYIYEAGTNMESKALSDINLKIVDKEFIAIIGHTGSGKSTLTQIMNGLIKPTKGQVVVDGLDINDKKYNLCKLHCKIGLVFQYPESQLFESSVLQDVMFGPINKGLSEKEAEQSAIEAMKMLELDEALYKKSPFELSGGEKRRVAIAGVMAMKPEIFILDEPTAGLDPESRDNLMKCLSTFREELGITVVIVSHSMELVAEYVDRIIVISEGEKKFDGDKYEVFSHSDELEKIGLAAPQNVDLLKRLKNEGFDIDTNKITMSETIAELQKCLKMLKKDV